MCIFNLFFVDRSTSNINVSSGVFQYSIDEASAKNNEKSKEIFAAYLKFMNQMSFATFLMLSMKVDMVNKNEKEMINLSHISLHQMNTRSKKKRHQMLFAVGGDSKTGDNDFDKMYDDDFYVASSDFKGIINGVADRGVKDGFKALNEFVESILLLLSKKCVLSDDMLIVCFEYCKTLKEYYNDDSMFNKFISLLKNTILECLDGDYENKDCKAFYYQYWKEYLLMSNIWLCPFSNAIDKSDCLLYGEIGVNTVQHALNNQKEFIWSNVVAEEKNDSGSWHGVMGFDYKPRLVLEQLRQDTIQHGLEMKDDITIEDMYTMAPVTEKSGFDAFNEYNNKVYLVKQLVFANKMHNIFTNDVKSIVDDICDENSISCSFGRAPVKLYDRCIIKACTDYADTDFPQTAAILDFLRCSITLEKPKDLLIVLEKFISKIEKNSYDGDNCVIDIVRIKNGFSKIASNWKSSKDCEYCDIKFNISMFFLLILFIYCLFTHRIFYASHLENSCV